MVEQAKHAQANAEDKLKNSNYTVKKLVLFFYYFLLNKIRLMHLLLKILN
jgi:hypothetical protein